MGVALAVSSADGRWRWSGAAGDLAQDTRYFIASTTKIYITTLLLQLREMGLLDLDHPISRHLSAEVMQGLSDQITIRHLMSHTSGLPDYFQAKRADGRSLMDSLFSGTDIGWSFDDAIQATKQLRPLFRPGAPGKAHYSDSNYQLLGRIIENRLESDLASAFRERIFDVLGLTQTYLYTDPADTKPAPLYVKSSKVRIPKAMCSFGADGGIVSIAQESLTFLEAFFAGRLFDSSILASLQKWNRIFFPLQSGTGLLRMKLPRILSPFAPPPEIIGHSGLSGAFAFRDVKSGIHLAGTVNQCAEPSQAFRLIFKALNVDR